MTSAAGRDAESVARHPTGAGPNWGVTASVFAALVAYSALARPAPSVNEPHYLCKAKHYWQPDWCRDDFFLNSSNPHLVFYETIGVLTKWLTFPEAAWAGRVIALGLLAWGWTLLTSRIIEHRWVPLGTVCLFLLLQALGNFSGEWLVGGVESKVVAYALAFAGMSYLIEGRPVPAGIGLGGALSFHPLVGGWCVIAVVIAACFRAVAKSPSETQQTDKSSEGGEPPQRVPNVRTWVIGGGLLVGCALPGVIPAIRILGDANPDMAVQADRVQVGLRLAHHLDPMAFPLTAYRYYGLLIGLWLLTRRSIPRTIARQWLVCIVAAAVLIALAGVLVGWGPRPLQEMPLADLRVWLLKFYPFRLADVLIPMLVSCSLAQTIWHWSQAGAGSTWRRWSGPAAAATALGLALLLPAPDRNPSRMPADKESDWRAACEWIRTESPRDTLLYAANEDWAVKWFCHRAEYVNYKDCPQDAAGILEWVRRLQRLRVWHHAAFADGRCSAEELRALHEQTGITHLLVSRLGPLDVEPVYRNDSFRVYQIAGESLRHAREGGHPATHDAIAIAGFPPSREGR